MHLWSKRLKIHTYLHCFINLEFNFNFNNNNDNSHICSTNIEPQFLLKLFGLILISNYIGRALILGLGSVLFFGFKLYWSSFCLRSTTYGTQLFKMYFVLLRRPLPTKWKWKHCIIRTHIGLTFTQYLSTFLVYLKNFYEISQSYVQY